jgi:hypothetical protein
MEKKKGIDGSSDIVARYLDSLKNLQAEDLEILKKLREGAKPEEVIPDEIHI